MHLEAITNFPFSNSAYKKSFSRVKNEFKAQKLCSPGVHKIHYPIKFFNPAKSNMHNVNANGSKVARRSLMLPMRVCSHPEEEPAKKLERSKWLCGEECL